MKKALTALCVVFAMVCLCSCTAARKPVQPQNKTYIVPEVTRITFEKIDLKSAPKVVRDIAKVMENKDAATWVQSGSNAYMIASQSEATGDYDIEFDEVLQRLPEQGFTWLDVKIKYTKRAETRPDSSYPVYAVVKADVNNPPQGVGFNIIYKENAANQQPQNVIPQALSGPLATPVTQPEANIDQPVPNQIINNTVKVKGVINGQGRFRVRISTSGGQIIREEKVNPAPDTGQFSLDMSYSPLVSATPGEVSIIKVNGNDEKVLTRVAVLIK